MFLYLYFHYMFVSKGMVLASINLMRQDKLFPMSAMYNLILVTLMCEQYAFCMLKFKKLLREISRRLACECRKQFLSNARHRNELHL